MNITPINKTVICTKIKSNEYKEKDGFIYFKKGSVPLYKVKSFSDDIENPPFKVGDTITVHSGGSLIDDNGTELYLFSYDSIAGVVKNETV